MKRLNFRSAPRALFMAGATLTLLASAAQAAVDIKPYFEFKKPKMITIDGDLSLDSFGASAPVFYTSGPVSLGLSANVMFDSCWPGKSRAEANRTQYTAFLGGVGLVSLLMSCSPRGISPDTG